MSTDTGFGDRLRSIITFRGLTISLFAKQASIPYRTLETYVLNKRKPGADQLAKLSRQGIDVPWLLTGEFPLPFRRWTRQAEKAPAMFGDLEFLQVVVLRVARDVDAFHERYRKRTGKQLPFGELNEVLAIYLDRCVETALVLNNLYESAQPRRDFTLLPDALAMGLDEHLDNEVDRALESIRRNNAETHEPSSPSSGSLSVG